MAKPDSALAVRKFLGAARGARLCYGDPVQVDGRTVIPVARVRAGGRFGRGGSGGGVDAVPVGFIEVAAEGTRFERIEQPRVGARVLAAGGAAVTGLMAAAALRKPKAGPASLRPRGLARHPLTRPRPTLPRPPRRRSLPR
jgi:hypothetical protein